MLVGSLSWDGEGGGGIRGEVLPNVVDGHGLSPHHSVYDDGW